MQDDHRRRVLSENAMQQEVLEVGTDSPYTVVSVPDGGLTCVEQRREGLFFPYTFAIGDRIAQMDDERSLLARLWVGRDVAQDMDIVVHAPGSVEHGTARVPRRRFEDQCSIVRAWEPRRERKPPSRGRLETGKCEHGRHDQCQRTTPVHVSAAQQQPCGQQCADRDRVPCPHLRQPFDARKRERHHREHPETAPQRRRQDHRRTPANERRRDKHEREPAASAGRRRH
jgi:hypothetical protein